MQRVFAKLRTKERFHRFKSKAIKLSEFRGITINEIVRDSGITASLQCLGLARQGGLGGFPRLNQTQKKSDTIIRGLDAIYGNEITKLVPVVHDYIVITPKVRTMTVIDSNAL